MFILAFVYLFCHKSINMIYMAIKFDLIKKDTDMFMTLFKRTVRPHLEYGSNIWSVIYKKEAMQIENVQRRATKLVKNISHPSYTERLKYLGLLSLQLYLYRKSAIFFSFWQRLIAKFSKSSIMLYGGKLASQYIFLLPAWSEFFFS